MICVGGSEERKNIWRQVDLQTLHPTVVAGLSRSIPIRRNFIEFMFRDEQEEMGDTNCLEE